MKKFKVALQTMVLHSVIDTEGIYEAARKAKEIGYNALEISGHFECNESRVAELCRARDDFGLEIAALNVAFSGGFQNPSPFSGFEPLSLEKDFSKVVSFAKQLGTRYIRYAGMPVEELDTLEKVKSYCATTQKYTKMLQAEGLTLCMHEHDEEFAKIDGRTYYSWMIELAPDLKFEFCVGGAAHAAMDLCDTLKSISGRVPLIHFTDIRIVPPTPGCGRRTLQEKIVSCPLGDGNIPVKKFCDTAMECNNEYFILECNHFFGEDPVAAMKRAADNLKAAGYADCF